MAEPNILAAGLFIATCGIFALVFLASIRAKEKEALERERPAKAVRDAKLFCPHCQQFGFVTTEPTTIKRGVSGGKVTAALLTGGVTMLATGLSQESVVTKATCSNCGSTWMF